MPWYKIELNVGISDKLSSYILTTYGNNNTTIKLFERTGNYTKFMAFAPSQAAVNNALNDLKSRLAEVTEDPTFDPGTG